VSNELVTRVCRFVLDERGFVRATILDGAEMTLDDAREALATTERVAGGERRPVLVDLRKIKGQSREARQHFVGEHAARISARVALLVGSPVSRVVGNFFLRLNVQRTPTELFTSEEAAVAWLQGRSR
jgi:hypothetical protein